MTDNRNSEAAWAYHEATKHSYLSIRTNPHFLDWANQPLPFKIYPTLERLRFPGEARPTEIATLSAIAESVLADTVAVPDLGVVAQLLYLSAGITRQRKYPGGEIYFRAAACTGALYEVELYLVCGDLANLEAGLYHFAPAEFGLRRLRVGDYRALLVEATAAEPAIAHAPVVVACTCIYWRNAWKYQARTYRHFGWDNGTVLANLLAVATALGLPAKVVCGFQDAKVNRLLDVDPQREVAFSLVALGHVSALPPQPPSEISPLGLETVPPSGREVDYPLMREMHAASFLHTAADQVSATYRAGRSPPASLECRDASGPDRAGHLATWFYPQVCPSADQFGAALHHARPSHPRRASRFPRSAWNSVKRPLLDCPCGRRA